MKDCADFEALLASQKLGLLESKEELRVATHVRTCEECTRFARALGEALTAAVPDEAPVAEVWAKLSEQLGEHRDGAGAGAKAVGATGLRVTLACTFCHATTLPWDKVFCAGCLAPHHQECFEEHGSCSAPGCAERRFVRPELARAEPARRSLRGAAGVVFVLAAVGGAGGIAALALSGGPRTGAHPAVPPGSLEVPVGDAERPVKPRETPREPGAERPAVAPTATDDRQVFDLPPPALDDVPVTPSSTPPPPPSKSGSSREESRPGDSPSRPLEAPFVTHADLRALSSGAVQSSEVQADPIHEVRSVPAECLMEVHRASAGGGARLVSSTRMFGVWATNAFVASPDRRTVLVHGFGGFRLLREGREVAVRVQLLYPYVSWSPDSKRLAVWLGAGVAVVEVEDLFRRPETKFRITHRASQGRIGQGMTWAGPDDLLVLERRHEEGSRGESRLVLVRAAGSGYGQQTTLLETDERVEWFLPHRRSGRLEAVVYGTPRSVGAVDARAGSLGSIAFEVGEVRNVAISPTGTEVALLSNRGGTHVALLLHLGRSVAETLEILGSSSADGGLAFSRTGTHIAWSTLLRVGVRSVRDKDGGFVLTGRDLGYEKEIGNIAWNEDEKRLAVAVGERMLVLDVVTRRADVAAKVGVPGSIAAEPVWVGEEILFSVFTDAADRRKR